MTLDKVDRPRGKAEETRRMAVSGLVDRGDPQRTALLLDLVNLPDDACKQIRRRYHWAFLDSDDEHLLEYRKGLREIWSGNVRTTSLAMCRWMEASAVSKQRPWQVLSVGYGNYAVIPNRGNLALSLALGVDELSPKMAVCANPDCPQPYFLKGRKTQKFCDRPACAAYGQREHKRNWWREHGKEWKEKRQPNKRRGKHAKAKKA